MQLRRIHATLAPLVIVPLLVTVLTGVIYRLARDWGGVKGKAAHWLMVIHQGEWLNPWLGHGAQTWYVLLNGLGLLWMLGTGAAMAWQRLRPARRPSPPAEGT